MQLRRIRRRPPPIDPIARIDALTATGRANWLGLLAYLSFALITTLGVEDVDFFVDSRQTQLPLVNVSIPTFSFFVFAPILGAALYAYLHLHIRKVTEALAEVPPGPPLPEERIKPWLLNDFVLRQRPDRDRAIRRRPLDALAGLTTWFLVWSLGPLVLGLMWVRTWPAHNLWLSLLCAACLMISLYAGAMSWTKMRQDLGHRLARWTVITTVLIVLLAAPVIWLTMVNSKGTWEYVIKNPELYEPSTAVQRIETWARDTTEKPKPSWQETTRVWLSDFATDLAELDPPDLTAARLSVLPPDQADLDTARHSYRTAYCARRGIDAEICDRAPVPTYDPPPHLASKRQEWCNPRGYLDGAETTCPDFFARLDSEFDQEWRVYRQAQIASIAKPDLRGKDLRRALLAQAELSGVDFRDAQLQGADLLGAQLEGADLGGAQLEGADLFGAQMQRANLGGAQMQQAILVGAQMQGADLFGAQMQGADLFGARIQGANLSRAQMQEAALVGAEMQGADLRRAEMLAADLYWAQMQEAVLVEAQMQGANLRRAEMQGTDLRRANLQSAEWLGASIAASPSHSADFRGGTGLAQAQLSSLIGDARTLLPDRPDPDTGELPFVPSCWPVEPEGWDILVKALSEKGGGRYLSRPTMTEEQMRAAFLCPAGQLPRKTGTPWPLDRAPPWDQDPNWQPEDRGPVD